jgi:hypothetical protein
MMKCFLVPLLAMMFKCLLEKEVSGLAIKENYKLGVDIPNKVLAENHDKASLSKPKTNHIFFDII